MRSMAGITIWSQIIAPVPRLAVNAFLVHLTNLVMALFTIHLGQFDGVFIFGVRILMAGNTLLFSMDGLGKNIGIHINGTVIGLPGEILITMTFQAILITHGQDIAAAHSQGKQNNEEKTSPALYLFPDNGFHVSHPV